MARPVLPERGTYHLDRPGTSSPGLLLGQSVCRYLLCAVSATRRARRTGSLGHGCWAASALSLPRIPENISRIGELFVSNLVGGEVCLWVPAGLLPQVVIYLLLVICLVHSEDCLRGSCVDSRGRTQSAACSRLESAGPAAAAWEQARVKPGRGPWKAAAWGAVWALL